MQIGLLISGNLGLTVFKEMVEKYKISFVLTDKNSYAIIDFCKVRDISFFAGNPRNSNVIHNLKYPLCDIIISVNYLFIIDIDLINYPKKFAINFHGSLLPKYRGRTPHVWAIINNEKETGISAHLMDKNCDSGDIIAQIKVPIKRDYTGSDILNIYTTIYPIFVNKVIDSIEKNTLKLIKQDNSKATFFGKRTSEDGLINWNWQKERIYNWVRAQAYPYPGSFSFINNEKIIINKIEFSSHGYNYETLNGKVVGFEKSNPIIKTSNGCIKILNYEFYLPIKLNDILK